MSQRDMQTHVLGRRSAVGLIDVAILGASFVALATLIGETENDANGVRAELTGAPALLWFSIVGAYFYVTELVAGRTPGKVLLGLRVVRTNGSAVDPGRLALRTVLRGIDAMPVRYLIGFLTALANDEGQRLGDIVADICVVRG